MINKGTEVLYGKLDEIKQKYVTTPFLLNYEGNVGMLKGVTEIRQKEDYNEFFWMKKPLRRISCSS
jgi:ABC-type uncharacterized transport system ATPase subunit